MTLKSVRRQALRRLIAIAILITGFGSAFVIYVTATPVPANPLGYDPEDTKQYLREMEVYGGKANVLGSEFRQWLESLWHGRRLAVTVVCLTLVLLLFFWVASTPCRLRSAPLLTVSISLTGRDRDRSAPASRSTNPHGEGRSPNAA